MYKLNSKSIIVLCIGICLFISFSIIEYFISDDFISIQTYSDILDKDMINSISNYNDGMIFSPKDYEIKESSNIEQSDLIIKTSSDEKIEGYEKEANFIYSPFVLLYGKNYYDENKVFEYNPSKNNSYKYPAYTDLKPLLEGIENNKKYSDIYNINQGIFHKDENKINLIIPSSEYGYDNHIIQLFMLSLNDGKEITSDIESELNKRAIHILSKCNRVESYANAINQYEKDENYKFIMLLPERSIIYTSRNRNHNIYCVYPKYQIVNYFDIFYKKDKNLNNFIKHIQQINCFSKNTGLRIKNSEFDYKNISAQLTETIK